MIPGLNVLSIAFGAIAQQRIFFRMSTGRVLNDFGNWVTGYADPIEMPCSWQPMEDKKYEQLGLDLAKEYHRVWIKAPAQGVKRGESPDQFIYGGKLHEVVDVKDWYGQDGWVEVLVIEIGDYVSEPQNA